LPNKSLEITLGDIPPNKSGCEQLFTNKVKSKFSDMPNIIKYSQKALNRGAKFNKKC